jgi:hypothetical protein
MQDQLELFITDRSENRARIVLRPRRNSGVSQITGLVRGPFSDFSKTLTADSPLKPGIDGTFEALIFEPCYWTPSLPFWYDLQLATTFGDGTTRKEVLPVGLKRFYCEGRNFVLEGKRVVLRGMQIDAPTLPQLDDARNHEAALIVNHVNEEICTSASRLGVPIVVDLRTAQPALDADLEWHPAIMAVIVHPTPHEFNRTNNSYSAVCVAAAGEKPTLSCDIYVIELQPGERPPPWAAACDKPVIVIRKDPDREIRTARAGCDMLQTELAPEFDLAGYFV